MKGFVHGESDGNVDVGGQGLCMWVWIQGFMFITGALGFGVCIFMDLNLGFRVWGLGFGVGGQSVENAANAVTRTHEKPQPQHGGV